ncbi:hypothetical protein [Anaerotignum sp.]
MKVEQYVMAYRAEQDRLRAMLPEGFTSLRPVLRINAEIRTGEAENVYIEYNTPVEGFGKRGWLNIAHWESPATELSYTKKENATTFYAPFLEITYTGVGLVGGCPAEKDNDGCFYGETFVPAEKIDENKEYCNCAFQWKFAEGNAQGISTDGKSIPAIPAEQKIHYKKQELTPENAANIPCEQVLGAYVVKFERK